MAVLKDLKRERFSNHVAEGKTQAQAYKLSGYTAKHIDSAASKLASHPEVKARIQELTGRITNRAIDKAVQQTAITKELIMRTLWENVQEARTVKGGSAVVNRGCELIGKELGLFREPEVKPPMKLEDLPEEVLASMLAEAEANAAKEREAAAEPPKVQ